MGSKKVQTPNEVKPNTSKCYWRDPKRKTFFKKVIKTKKKSYKKCNTVDLKVSNFPRS